MKHDAAKLGRKWAPAIDGEPSPALGTFKTKKAAEESSVELIFVNPETGEFLKLAADEPIPEGYVLAGA